MTMKQCYYRAWSRPHALSDCCGAGPIGELQPETATGSESRTGNWMHYREPMTARDTARSIRSTPRT